METSLILTFMTLAVISSSVLADQGRSASAEKVATSQATALKYLSLEERQQWSAKMRSQLLIVKRETGPFGLSQDLSVKKVVESQQKVVKSDAFPKAIAAISIPVVMGKSFLIGGQEYRQGGVYSLEGKENKFNIKVILVTSEQIEFQNVDTQERVVKKLNVQPRGLQPNAGFDTVPGVRPANKGPSTIESDK